MIDHALNNHNANARNVKCVTGSVSPDPRGSIYEQSPLQVQGTDFSGGLSFMCTAFQAFSPAAPKHVPSEFPAMELINVRLATRICCHEGTVVKKTTWPIAWPGRSQTYLRTSLKTEFGSDSWHCLRMLEQGVSYDK